MKKTTFFIILGLAILGGILAWIMLSPSSPVPSGDSEMQATEKTYTGGTYTDYDENKLASLSGDIVLFFHADWCPTCIAADHSFLASGIPAGLHILKIDFDTSPELKKKYLVLTQTSFVHISSTGAMIQRWVGARDIDDIVQKVAEAKELKGGKAEKPKSDTGSQILATAYFAGGCFWCMEGPFESLPGVKEVINGYIGGSANTATYTKVSMGITKHRESVKVVYDPSIVSYSELLDQYRRQIDPTDAGGQFADRGFHYTTAIYYSTDQEKTIALQSKKKLEDSRKFSKPIAVEILPAVPFYPAEDYHQDYYKKNAAHYNSYKKGSGREDFIHTTRTGEIAKAKAKANTTVSRRDKEPKKIEDLTAEQRRILFEGGTEPAFHNAYRDNHEAGIYVDVIDGTPLFSSTDKFDSGTGRPAFTRPIEESLVGSKTDTTRGMKRIEITSSSSKGHLGHVFDDGPADAGGMRYCINSAALRFVSVADLEKEGYSEYKVLFKQYERPPLVR